MVTTVRRLALMLFLMGWLWVAVGQAKFPPTFPPQKSLLKSAATRAFNKPLFFDLSTEGNRSVFPPMEVEYDLSLDNGKTLKIGNIELNEKSFSFSLIPLRRGHPSLAQILSESEGERFALLIKWPERLFRSGALEMISRRGDVLWRQALSENDLEEWNKTQAKWRTQLIEQGVSAKKLGSEGIFGIRLGILNVASKGAPFWNQPESFRFCLSGEEGRYSTRICSQWYGTKSKEDEVRMGRVRGDVISPRVLINNKVVKPKNSLPVSMSKPTSFYAELAGGESYEFFAVPNKLDLMDISDDGNQSTLNLIGFNQPPMGPFTILNPDQYSELTELLGFEATIGDPRKFWLATMDREEPRVYLPGKGGGVFTQRLELSEVPRERARAFLHAQAPTGTYIDGIQLRGRKQPSAKIKTKEISVEVDKENPSLFSWNFRAGKRGKLNRAFLDVEMEGKTYRSYFELYKGFPRELSGRFTGVASKEFIFMGEVAYNQWFEDIFDSTDYFWSRQRWGLSAKYFRSINQLTVDAAGSKVTLEALTADLKYRLTPGLWGRDETVGAVGSYQNATIGALKAPMFGVGFFWARSMPRVFDELFNMVPLLRYPKWVDMEFLYYAMSLDSNVSLIAPLALNFHGKILWTERIFGEAGFGIKRYGFSSTSINKKAELNTFYGTVGLGINF